MSASGSVEREAKFDIAADFVMPALDEVLPGITMIDLGTSRLDAVYWDTADLRLVTGHFGMRYRSTITADGARSATWTVKEPSQQRQGFQERGEHDFAGAPDRPPAAAVALIGSRAHRDDLRPIVRVFTDRHAWHLVRGNTAMVELAIDDVTVLHDGRSVGKFTELEVEVIEATDGELAAVVEALVNAGAAPSQRSSKYVRALEMAGLM